MLAKIHLRTACGCTQTYFQRIDMIPWVITKPTYMRGMFSSTRPVHGKREFKFAGYKSKSNHRIELWYEEVA